MKAIGAILLILQALIVPAGLAVAEGTQRVHSGLRVVGESSKKHPRTIQIEMPVTKDMSNASVLYPGVVYEIRDVLGSEPRDLVLGGRLVADVAIIRNSQILTEIVLVREIDWINEWFRASIISCVPLSQPLRVGDQVVFTVSFRGRPKLDMYAFSVSGLISDKPSVVVDCVAPELPK